MLLAMSRFGPLIVRMINKNVHSTWKEKWTDFLIKVKQLIRSKNIPTLNKDEKRNCEVSLNLFILSAAPCRNLHCECHTNRYPESLLVMRNMLSSGNTHIWHRFPGEKICTI